MNAKKLEKLGFNKIWLKDVIDNFHPKSKGKYTMKIYDMESIDQEPDSGIYIDTTCFDNERELSIIHHFFEGLGYVMTITETGEEIGRGIIDGAPFEEVDEAEGLSYGTWQWLREEDIGSKYLYNQNKQIAMYQSCMSEGEDLRECTLRYLRNRLAEIRTSRKGSEEVRAAQEKEVEMLIYVLQLKEEYENE